MTKVLFTADTFLEAQGILEKLTRGLEHPIRDYNQRARDYQELLEILQENKIIQGYISDISLEKIRLITIRCWNSLIYEKLKLRLTDMLTICSVDDSTNDKPWLEIITDNELGIDIEIEIACAITNNIQAIVTPNPQNFIGYNLPIPILSVSDLLERLHLEELFSIEKISHVWKLLPPPSALREFRLTDAEDLENIWEKIGDVKVPDAADCGYWDFELTELKLRLYAINWYSLGTEKNWSLLLILRAMPGNQTPLGVQLQINDMKDVLYKQVLDSEHDYLFTQMEGNIEEKFLATITSANGEAETSVVFECCPE